MLLGRAASDRRHLRYPLVGVAAVLFCEDLSRVLLVKRGQEPHRGLWSAPGGLVEFGESLAQACAREVLEETGLQADIREPIALLERRLPEDSAPEYHYVIIDFWGYVQGVPTARSDAEAARLVAADEVGQLHATDGLGEVVQRAIRVARGQAPSLWPGAAGAA